jgi:hypothetical protein
MNGVKLSTKNIIEEIVIDANNGVIFNRELYLTRIEKLLFEYTEDMLKWMAKEHVWFRVDEHPDCFSAWVLGDGLYTDYELVQAFEQQRSYND